MSVRTWSDVFTERSRRKIGREAKTVTRAEQIVWTGYLDGISIRVVSTVKSAADRSLLHFLTSSNARLNFSADFLNYVELHVEPYGLPAEMLMTIQLLADTADDRRVVVVNSADSN